MPPDEKTNPQRRYDDSFDSFKSTYWKQHSELEQRVAKLEACIDSLATREDVQMLKTEIVTEIGKMLPAQTDIDWLKKAYWAAVGALASFGFGVLLLLIGHFMGKI